ncbi:hypothetical protein JYT88_01490 [Rhodospirillaceae bacterium AH-315-P19]|nr:hypothetical protein [Rhodospirillaceae bacterium AH-315-P19]
MSTLNAAMGYPKPETKTESYTVPVPHPVDSRAVCAVDGDAETHLSSADRAALVDRAAMEEFFPTEGV